MRNYHSHTLLYLHETVSLGSGRSDRFTEVFTGTETVPKIVAHGLWELSRRPEQLAAVRAHPQAQCRPRARN